MKIFKITFIFIIILLTTNLCFYGQESIDNASMKIKSMFVYNFAKNTEWPSEVIDKNLIIAVLGGDDFSNDFYDLLKNTYNGKNEKNYTVEIIHYKQLSDVNKPHVLYISDEYKNQMDKVNKQIADFPTLTVGSDFPFHATMINFNITYGKLAFSINDAELKIKKLTLSPPMYKVATEVKTEKEWLSLIEKLEDQVSQNFESIQKEDVSQLIKEYKEKDLVVLDQHKKLGDKETEILSKEDTIKNQRYMQYLTFGILIIIAIFSVFVYFSYRNKKKSNDLIQEKNNTLEKQKTIIEEAHKEITDSINYAERIQRSFLASKELLDVNLKDYFVFFRPKDVVSGDFYWADTLSNGDFAIVNADSTGHGVPGAIMSILNISSIESALKDNLVKPADIFNYTRNTIIERLKKDGSAEGGKDGMDASLISINATKTKINYVAAQNPIWIIRNGKLIEIKPEKMPVGKHENDKIPFKGGSFNLQSGDQIYTLTDGFQDQFGGPKGKKFMVKKMRDYILSLSHLPMQEQKELIATVFSEWKGEMEQVDDVCVIGIKI